MKILVPIDGSKNSMEGLKVASEMAASEKKAAIVLMTVVPYIPGMDLEISANEMEGLTTGMKHRGEELLEKAKKIIERKGLSVKTVLLSTSVSAAEEILDVAEKEKVGLVVIGAHGLGGKATRFFMGSVAWKVIRHAPCSVYVVKILS